MGILALAVAARLIRYSLRFPLWSDEAQLAANFLDRGYRELLQPLDFHQVAPWLYLWVQATIIKVLGFSEYSLRLFALLGSLASLPLFVGFARCLVRGKTLILAVAVFACSYTCVISGSIRPVTLRGRRLSSTACRPPGRWRASGIVRALFLAIPRLSPPG